ncbi:UBP-type zinc finger domain-containing protein [Williamsia sterculiae]|uniref:Ubiquitin-hydrolase Zn-finger-containing protein n=1 Tax=Williamsia sterculiae TaxID=1344003 RepID=A0A1N7CPW7_9NOCA|nr:UBP-type zinc finger domain-containing protein [Williamsia sterculiae]SIR65659.1 ubiquitin-hydrolase Zn-finger-containing protein [Williamsia sterculiae]
MRPTRRSVMHRLMRPQDLQPQGCEHLLGAPGPEQEPPADGDDPDDLTYCRDCWADGREVWAHLRKCLQCGHVACCDSSPRRHSDAHFKASGHPVMRSVEPGEHWRWCFVDREVG